MNPNLNKLGSQLLAVWKQLGVSQRVSVVLATGAVLVSLLGVAFWSSRTEYGLLYGRMADGEAAKVVAALDDAKVPYKIGSGGGSIYVPAEKVHVMRMQLAGKGLPRGDGVGFEIFDKPNFGISDFIQRANYVRAIQGELGRTISQLDDIETARVMIVMPENRLLLDRDKHPTASVFVRVRGNSQLAPSSINSIRFLVANSVEGLRPNFVTVVDNLGNTLSENVEDDSLVGLSTTQLAARRNLEQYLSKKTESLLEKVLGPGQALVRVSAEVNYDTITRTEEKYDPEGQVIRTQTKNDENNNSSTSSPNSEAVGLSANTPPEPGLTNLSSNPVSTTVTRKTTATTEYDNAKTISNILQSAGGIRHLSAAVTVAAKVEGSGEAAKIVSRSTDELEKLRRIVQSALGADLTRGDQIVLEEMPFNDRVAVGLTQRLDRQQQHDFWWNLVKGLFYPGLALGILMIFLRLLKRTPADILPVGIPVGELMGHGNGNGNGRGNGHGLLPGGWKRDTAPGVVTADVLNQLIKENPANMSQAIRTWLTRGGPPLS